MIVFVVCLFWFILLGIVCDGWSDILPSPPLLLLINYSCVFFLVGFFLRFPEILGKSQYGERGLDIRY